MSSIAVSGQDIDRRRARRVDGDVRYAEDRQAISQRGPAVAAILGSPQAACRRACEDRCGLRGVQRDRADAADAAIVSELSSHITHWPDGAPIAVADAGRKG